MPQVPSSSKTLRGRQRMLGLTTALTLAACLVLCVLGGLSRAGAQDTAAAPVLASEGGAVSPALAAGAIADPMAGKEGRKLNPMMLLLFVFLISVFLGVELLTKVPSQLHTPLMSGSNAISGITIVGACIAAGQGANSWLLVFVGVLAMTCAMINVVGGYLVTNRMLQMFQGKEGNKK